ncbi:unnamed protein product [Porites evermanni]|uniref:Reverse transcriptase domain-containing protein n=1 Tax=Porites evermanni TaxID=104178 RepID=A0ABN8RC81_9CNID|nr:unnamed protein product [Porites evermanni]
MIQDRLMINDDKTEFLLLGTRQQLDKLDLRSITVGNNRISRSPCVKNLLSRCLQAPKLWNGLPVELRQATSPSSFKSRLKTYLFKKYFYSL